MIRMIGMLIAVSAVAVQAAEWPNFCGPDRNNISAETGLVRSFPKSGPVVEWELPLAEGYAAPAIKDGKVYVLDRKDQDNILRCLELSSGKELWNCPFADPGELARFPGTRGVPTVTDDALYVVGGFGTFVCIDLKTQTVKWQKQLVEDYGGEQPMFGVFQSPVLVNDLVLVNAQSLSNSVVAFDAKTGEQRWAAPGINTFTYVSPTVVTLCGEEQVVAIGGFEVLSKTRSRSRTRTPNDEKKPKEKKSSGGMVLKPEEGARQGAVMGISLKDGSVLWRYEGWQCRSPIPTPTAMPGDKLFITGGYEAGTEMIQLEKKDGVYSVKSLYKTEDVGTQLHQPILYKNHFYIGSNSNSRNDGLACFTPDGKLVWRTKDIDGAPNFQRGSLILADDMLIILDGKTGFLHLVDPSPEGYKEFASAKIVAENDETWMPLALSNGKLLVRDKAVMKCLNIKK